MGLKCFQFISRSTPVSFRWTFPLSLTSHLLLILTMLSKTHPSQQPSVSPNPFFQRQPFSQIPIPLRYHHSHNSNHPLLTLHNYTYSLQPILSTTTLLSKHYCLIPTLLFTKYPFCNPEVHSASFPHINSPQSVSPSNHQPH